MQRAAAAALLASSLAILPSTALAAWTRGYVIEWAEPAMYYGASSGTLEPGTDCPAGTNPEPDWVQVMVKAGYQRDEAVWMFNPANPTRIPNVGQNQMAFRGKDRVNVYMNPTATPESGHLVPVSGTIGEGVDLDGNLANGFTGLKGEKGVDNEFYRAMGCWKNYRGPQRMAAGPLSQNGYMLDGRFTIVMVVSGAGDDPMNDPDVKVGFYDSADKLVKDGMGNVSRDYTFTVRPSTRYEALFDAKTVNGRIVSKQAMDEVWFREASYVREVQLLKARLDLTMKPDGALTGYVGGYRPWKPVYDTWVSARGPIIETLTWVQLPDVYYALRKYADYSPAGAGGEKSHISYAMRIDAVPAYVMVPGSKMQVADAGSFKSQAAAPEKGPEKNPRIINGLLMTNGALGVSQTAEQLRPPVRVAGTQ